MVVTVVCILASACALVAARVSTGDNSNVTVEFDKILRFYDELSEHAKATEHQHCASALTLAAEYLQQNITDIGMEHFVEGFRLRHELPGYMSQLSFWTTSALHCFHTSGYSHAAATEFPTDYCLMSERNMKLGACLPSNCSNQMWLMRQLHKQMDGHKTNHTPNAAVVECFPNRNAKQWFEQPWALFCIGLLFGLMSLCLIATVHQCHDRHMRGPKSVNQSMMQQSLYAFSIVDNLQRIRKQPAVRGSSITCIGGLRMLSLIWVIVGHSYILLPAFIVNKREMGDQIVNSFFAQVITNFTLSVDTFFVLGGCVVAYSFFKKQLRLVSKNAPTVSWRSTSFWLRFYRHRLIRVWPGYIFCLLIVTCLYSTTHHHPWPVLDDTSECSSTWWQNLLFINTFTNANCLTWTWYLGNDFLYFAFSPLIMLLLDWSRTIGQKQKSRNSPAIQLMIALLCVLCCCINVLVMYINGLPPTNMFFVENIMFDNTNTDDTHNMLYIRPWTRFGPYLVGIWIGYTLAHYDDRNNECQILANSNLKTSSIAPKAAETRLSTGVQAAGWIISFVIGFWSLFGLWPALQGYDWMLYHYIFGGTFRLLFSLAIAWIMYACHTGHAAWVDRCLSAAWIVPLANLSFGTYLFHLLGVVGTNIAIGFFRTWSGHLSYSLVILLQIAAGYIAGGLKTSLLVELPVTNLERLFLTNGSPTKTTQLKKTDTTATIISNVTKEEETMFSNVVCVELENNDDNNNNSESNNNNNDENKDTLCDKPFSTTA